MAITNHERVGKALELLKSGLGPFVEREITSLDKDRAPRLGGKAADRRLSATGGRDRKDEAASTRRRAVTGDCVVGRVSPCPTRT